MTPGKELIDNFGHGRSGDTLPRKMLKFYSRRDVFSCILKLQTMSFIYQKRMTFLDNLISSQSTVLFAMHYGAILVFNTQQTRGFHVACDKVEI